MQDSFFLPGALGRTCRSPLQQGKTENSADVRTGESFREQRTLLFLLPEKARVPVTLSLPLEDIPQMVLYAGDILVTAPWRTRVVMPDSFSGRAVAAHAPGQDEAGYVDIVAGMEEPAQGDAVAAYPVRIDLHEADIEGQPPRKTGLRHAQSLRGGTREDIFSLNIDKQGTAVRLLTGYGQSEHAGNAEAPAGFLKERSQGFFAAVQGGSGGKREVQEESRNK